MGSDLPTEVRGERVDDRRVNSGIVHVLRSGCRGLRLSARIWSADDDLKSLRELGSLGELVPRVGRCGRSADTQMINSTHGKAHRNLAEGGEKKQAVGRSRGGRNKDPCTRRC